jgi:chromate transporter
MGTLINIFLMFAKLSTFSFGGGYVMIPIMLSELERNGLASASQVTDIVAIAGMSPGPVALNAAVGLGYKVASFSGAFASALGILIPNCTIVILAASFFFKIYKSKYVTSAFYGLRPVVTGIILYAAVSFALKNSIIAANSDKLINSGYNFFLGGAHIFEVKSIVLVIAAYMTLLKTKVHPIAVIAISGTVGTIIFR